MKTSAGYVGTDTEEDISDWFTKEDFKKYTGEVSTIEEPNFFVELEQAAIKQQGFEWAIEEVEEE